MKPIFFSERIKCYVNRSPKIHMNIQNKTTENKNSNYCNTSSNRRGSDT